MLIDLGCLLLQIDLSSISELEASITLSAEKWGFIYSSAHSSPFPVAASGRWHLLWKRTPVPKWPFVEILIWMREQGCFQNQNNVDYRSLKRTIHPTWQASLLFFFFSLLSLYIAELAMGRHTQVNFWKSCGAPAPSLECTGANALKSRKAIWGWDLISWKTSSWGNELADFYKWPTWKNCLKYKAADSGGLTVMAKHTAICREMLAQCILY